MKKLILFVLTAFLTLLVLACGKKEEPPQVKQPVTEKQVQQQAKEALDTLKAYTEQQKEEYQKKVTDQVAELQKKMEEMKAQFDKAAPEMKARLDKEMAEAKGNLDTLQKNLGDMKTATGKAWEEMKGNVNQILEGWQKSGGKPEKEGR
jgi:Tfp pilus assembly protein PilP